jgi:hypothetical protein
VRKIILLSGVLVPALLGLVAARDPRPKRGVVWLFLSFAAFEFGYALLLYYVWLHLSD